MLELVDSTFHNLYIVFQKQDCSLDVIRRHQVDVVGCDACKKSQYCMSLIVEGRDASPISVANIKTKRAACYEPPRLSPQVASLSSASSSFAADVLLLLGEADASPPFPPFDPLSAPPPSLLLPPPVHSIQKNALA